MTSVYEPRYSEDVLQSYMPEMYVQGQRFRSSEPKQDTDTLFCSYDPDLDLLTLINEQPRYSNDTCYQK